MKRSTDTTTGIEPTTITGRISTQALKQLLTELPHFMYVSASVLTDNNKIVPIQFDRSGLKISLAALSEVKTNIVQISVPVDKITKEINVYYGPIVYFVMKHLIMACNEVINVINSNLNEGAEPLNLIVEPKPTKTSSFQEVIYRATGNIVPLTN